jgi:hypothetical protein
MIPEREDVVTVRRVAVVSEDASCMLLCRLGKRVFHVPRYQLANGTFALRPGREADLVLPRWFAEGLGLVARA